MGTEDINDLSYEESIQRHRENRREKLLRATAAVFARTGIAQVSMDKVAKEVGVTKVVLYRYFKSKDELVDTILGEFVDRLLAADSLDVGWGRKRVTDNLILIRENQDAFMLLVRHANHDPKFGRHYLRLFDELVDHTLKRLTRELSGRKNEAIKLKFVAERISSLLLESVIGWIESGDPKKDTSFVSWLVRSSSALAQSWVDPPS